MKFYKYLKIFLQLESSRAWFHGFLRRLDSELQKYKRVGPGQWNFNPWLYCNGLLYGVGGKKPASNLTVKLLFQHWLHWCRESCWIILFKAIEGRSGRGRNGTDIKFPGKWNEIISRIFNSSQNNLKLLDIDLFSVCPCSYSRKYTRIAMQFWYVIEVCC